MRSFIFQAKKKPNNQPIVAGINLKMSKMPQIKISLNDANLDFISNFRNYGCASKSAIIDDAVKKLHQKVSNKALLESAELYQQIYQSDSELQELTESAASSCLE